MSNQNFALDADRRWALKATGAWVGVAAGMVTGGLASAAPLAQPAWPQRPVRLWVGFPPGSTPDLAARVMAERLARAWGHAVVVDNKPGASGNLAADAVAKARDDHTLGLVINGNLTTAAQLNPALPFQPARDLLPLSLVATAPLVLVASASAPSGAVFLAAARDGGTRWNFGSVGVGSVGHLGMEALKEQAGWGAQHIPYNGNPAVLTALISGQVQLALMPPGVALPAARNGQVRAIALAAGRSTLAPDVPSLAELGLAGTDLEVWVALVGPAGLSAAARQRLGAELPTLLREPEVRQRFFAAGWQVQASAPEALQRRVSDETARFGALIRRLQLRAE